MERVTEEMKESAKEYLRRRLDNELSYSTNLTKYINTAIEGICAIVSRYSITAEQLMDGHIPKRAKREIDEIIAELVTEITSAVFTLSRDNRDELKWFSEFMVREYEDGWNFDKRVSFYTDNLEKQIVMAIAALSLLDVSSTSWAKSIEGNIKDIYDAPFIKAVARERISFFSPMHLGRGVPHNMAVALDYLGRSQIANAWMEWDFEVAKRDKALGYRVFRGSSYPCPECDYNASVFHSMSEGLCVPSHSSCRCYVVYIY